ncbi:hypothetical protein [Pseudoalteromonas citrea]|uniref:hypothetical protein n=1 Tax=Pseudoalteromonas citrea TaxID=43655 RepID=UPI00110BAAFE|nr:hypothetical protein [Pseudoalteromonas citrea]
MPVKDLLNTTKYRAFVDDITDKWEWISNKTNQKVSTVIPDNRGLIYLPNYHENYVVAVTPIDHNMVYVADVPAPIKVTHGVIAGLERVVVLGEQGCLQIYSCDLVLQQSIALHDKATDIIWADDLLWVTGPDQHHINIFHTSYDGSGLLSLSHYRSVPNVYGVKHLLWLSNARTVAAVSATSLYFINFDTLDTTSLELPTSIQHVGGHHAILVFTEQQTGEPLVLDLAHRTIGELPEYRSITVSNDPIIAMKSHWHRRDHGDYLVSIIAISEPGSAEQTAIVQSIEPKHGTQLNDQPEIVITLQEKAEHFRLQSQSHCLFEELYNSERFQLADIDTPLLVITQGCQLQIHREEQPPELVQKAWINNEVLQLQHTYVRANGLHHRAYLRVYEQFESTELHDNLSQGEYTGIAWFTHDNADFLTLDDPTEGAGFWVGKYTSNLIPAPSMSEFIKIEFPDDTVLPDGTSLTLEYRLKRQNKEHNDYYYTAWQSQSPVGDSNKDALIAVQFRIYMTTINLAVSPLLYGIEIYYQQFNLISMGMWDLHRNTKMQAHKSKVSYFTDGSHATDILHTPKLTDIAFTAPSNNKNHASVFNQFTLDDSITVQWQQMNYMLHRTKEQSQLGSVKFKPSIGRKGQSWSCINFNLQRWISSFSHRSNSNRHTKGSVASLHNALSRLGSHSAQYTHLGASSEPPKTSAILNNDFKYRGPRTSDSVKSDAINGWQYSQTKADIQTYLQLRNLAGHLTYRNWQFQLLKSSVSNATGCSFGANYLTQKHVQSLDSRFLHDINHSAATGADVASFKYQAPLFHANSAQFTGLNNTIGILGFEAETYIMQVTIQHSPNDLFKISKSVSLQGISKHHSTKDNHHHAVQFDEVMRGEHDNVTDYTTAVVAKNWVSKPPYSKSQNNGKFNRGLNYIKKAIDQWQPDTAPSNKTLKLDYLNTIDMRYIRNLFSDSTGSFPINDKHHAKIRSVTVKHNKTGTYSTDTMTLYPNQQYHGTLPKIIHASIASTLHSKQSENLLRALSASDKTINTGQVFDFILSSSLHQLELKESIQYALNWLSLHPSSSEHSYSVEDNNGEYISDVIHAHRTSAIRTKHQAMQSYSQPNMTASSSKQLANLVKQHPVLKSDYHYTSQPTAPLSVAENVSYSLSKEQYALGYLVYDVVSEWAGSEHASRMRFINDLIAHQVPRNNSNMVAYSNKVIQEFVKSVSSSESVSTSELIRYLVASYLNGQLLQGANLSKETSTSIVNLVEQFQSVSLSSSFSEDFSATVSHTKTAMQTMALSILKARMLEYQSRKYIGAAALSIMDHSGLQYRRYRLIKKGNSLPNSMPFKHHKLHDKVNVSNKYLAAKIHREETFKQHSQFEVGTRLYQQSRLNKVSSPYSVKPVLSIATQLTVKAQKPVASLANCHHGFRAVSLDGVMQAYQANSGFCDQFPVQRSAPSSSIYSEATLAVFRRLSIDVNPPRFNPFRASSYRKYISSRRNKNTYVPTAIHKWKVIHEHMETQTVLNKINELNNKKTPHLARYSRISHKWRESTAMLHQYRASRYHPQSITLGRDVTTVKLAKKVRFQKVINLGMTQSNIINLKVSYNVGIMSPMIQASHTLLKYNHIIVSCSTATNNLKVTSPEKRYAARWQAKVQSQAKQWAIQHLEGIAADFFPINTSTTNTIRQLMSFKFSKLGCTLSDLIKHAQQSASHTSVHRPTLKSKSTAIYQQQELSRSRPLFRLQQVDFLGTHLQSKVKSIETNMTKISNMSYWVQKIDNVTMHNSGMASYPVYTVLNKHTHTQTHQLSVAHKVFNLWVERKILATINYRHCLHTDTAYGKEQSYRTLEVESVQLRTHGDGMTTQHMIAQPFAFGIKQTSAPRHVIISPQSYQLSRTLLTKMTDKAVGKVRVAIAKQASTSTAQQIILMTAALHKMAFTLSKASIAKGLNLGALASVNAKVYHALSQVLTPLNNYQGLSDSYEKLVNIYSEANSAFSGAQQDITLHANHSSHVALGIAKQLVLNLAHTLHALPPGKANDSSITYAANAIKEWADTPSHKTTSFLAHTDQAQLIDIANHVVQPVSMLHNALFEVIASMPTPVLAAVNHTVQSGFNPQLLNIILRKHQVSLAMQSTELTKLTSKSYALQSVRLDKQKMTLSIANSHSWIDNLAQHMRITTQAAKRASLTHVKLPDRINWHMTSGANKYNRLSVANGMYYQPWSKPQHMITATPFIAKPGILTHQLIPYKAKHALTLSEAARYWFPSLRLAFPVGIPNWLQDFGPVSPGLKTLSRSYKQQDNSERALKIRQKQSHDISHRPVAPKWLRQAKHAASFSTISEKWQNEARNNSTLILTQSAKAHAVANEVTVKTYNILGIEHTIAEQPYRLLMEKNETFSCKKLEKLSPSHQFKQLRLLQDEKRFANTIRQSILLRPNAHATKIKLWERNSDATQFTEGLAYKHLIVGKSNVSNIPYNSINVRDIFNKAHHIRSQPLKGTPFNTISYQFIRHQNAPFSPSAIKSYNIISRLVPAHVHVSISQGNPYKYDLMGVTSLTHRLYSSPVAINVEDVARTDVPSISLYAKKIAQVLRHTLIAHSDALDYTFIAKNNANQAYMQWVANLTELTLHDMAYQQRHTTFSEKVRKEIIYITRENSLGNHWYEQYNHTFSTKSHDELVINKSKSIESTYSHKQQDVAASKLINSLTQAFSQDAFLNHSYQQTVLGESKLLQALVQTDNIDILLHNALEQSGMSTADIKMVLTQTRLNLADRFAKLQQENPQNINIEQLYQEQKNSLSSLHSLLVERGVNTTQLRHTFEQLSASPSKNSIITKNYTSYNAMISVIGSAFKQYLLSDNSANMHYQLHRTIDVFEYKKFIPLSYQTPEIIDFYTQNMMHSQKLDVEFSVDMASVLNSIDYSAFKGKPVHERANINLPLNFKSDDYRQYKAGIITIDLIKWLQDLRTHYREELIELVHSGRAKGAYSPRAAMQDAIRNMVIEPILYRHPEDGSWMWRQYSFNDTQYNYIVWGNI